MRGKHRERIHNDRKGGYDIEVFVRVVCVTKERCVWREGRENHISFAPASSTNIVRNKDR